MRNLGQKRVWRNIMQSTPVLIFLGFLVLIFAWSVLGFWNKMQDNNKSKQIAEDKLTSLMEQKEKLTSDINSLQTDQGKERVFRENFGLVKEGEDVIVIVEDKNKPQIPLEANSQGFLGGFFSFFTNWFK